MDAAQRYVPRLVGLPIDMAPPAPEVILNIDAHGLATIAEMVICAPAIDPDVDHLDLDMPSVQDAMLDLQTRMATIISSDFDDVVSHCTRDVEVVAYFLALLELARWGIVRVSQEEPNAAIALTYDEKAADKRLRTMLSPQGEE
jgi:hypothetical protein